MTLKTQAARYWETLLSVHPRRSRFSLNELLEAFRSAFPHQEADPNVRERVAALLHQLAEEGVLRLPKRTNRRAYDHAERTVLPRYINRSDRPRSLPQPALLWRPELAFAHDVPKSWHDVLSAIQEWLRNGGTGAPAVAIRERSVEIFGDEKYLDGMLGTQLFSAGRLSLALLHCYLPSVPIYVEAIDLDDKRRPLLVLENLTTFDTLRRWNQRQKRYSAVAFGAGTAFVSSCRSLSSHLATAGCSGSVLYFGDLDPKGLWIPVRATRESGISIRPDEHLYFLLFQKARNKFGVQKDPFVYEAELLDWLPADVRGQAKQCLMSGRRLPQELISIYDLDQLRDLGAVKQGGNMPGLS
jgi:hypothetical protein